MIDTNLISSTASTPGAVAQTLNAWNVVALGVGVFLTQAYHVIVRGGGLKNIARKLWSGESNQESKSS
jgi:hypothetical protein